ncbi:hypothetical protein FVEG_04270 [Fusarium verticillioides 7600]|uniref:Uncharacterized protein n=1 Tax=Gibberella moniliformis (strain M3125 / FGSC 7600) TaxID=334819 RepID=W7MCA9_GIBM7|nr:hypothetical protein FVEG_04270 [Fusarium verticillioides 7600]EWG42477.1 hypothetical protein FVEG_04270 [Fusarium verticillioides 7600]RBQ85084.1 hypothetical protein FVER53263_04270 [Fusarium verticillioides]RBR04472.1 hypothetical protein FVER53590_04270 [Fusarium verticillioides]
MSHFNVKGSKLCLKSYDNNGVVNNIFFIQKDVPCPNLLGKLQHLGAVEAITPEMAEMQISSYFLHMFLLVLLNYFIIRKQLNPKSNGDAKNQRSGDSTTKFKPLAWIQRSARNRAHAVMFSSWMVILQFSLTHNACRLASFLTYQAYLADLEWEKPYVMSLIIAAIRILLFTFGTLGSLCPMYYAMKAQKQYILALINLELSPEQKIKDKSLVPQELPAPAPPTSVPQASTPPASAPRQTAPYLEITRESPYEREKRAIETPPKRRTPTPALPPPLPPRINNIHSMTTAQYPTSAASQQGPKTPDLQPLRSPSVGHAPPSYTDSTTNGANDDTNQAAFDIIRRLNDPAISRQRQRVLNKRHASSSTGRVRVGQVVEENATKSSDSPGQPEDWEYVHHEEGK